MLQQLPPKPPPRQHQNYILSINLGLSHKDVDYCELIFPVFSSLSVGLSRLFDAKIKFSYCDDFKTSVVTRVET